MGITRLKRKARRNKKTAATRQNSIKQLNASPVLKNIDKEAAKAAFTTGSKVPKSERIDIATPENVEIAVEETVKTEEVETPEASAEEVVSEEVESVEEEAPEEGEKEG